MSFSSTITITGSTIITNFDIYQCITSECSDCVLITGSTGQDVSRIKLLTGHTVTVDQGFRYIKLLAKTETCDNSICMEVMGIPIPTSTPTATSTSTPTATSTSTPTPTSTVTPTPTPTSTETPTPTSTPTITVTTTVEPTVTTTPNCEFDVNITIPTPTETPSQLYPFYRSNGAGTDNGHCDNSQLMSELIYSTSNTIPFMLNTTIYSQDEEPFNGGSLYYAVSVTSGESTDIQPYYVILVNSAGNVDNVYQITDCDGEGNIQ